MAPIHLAVYKGSLEIVRFLLKNNANINAVSDGCLVPYSYVTAMNSKTEIKEMRTLWRIREGFWESEPPTSSNISTKKNHFRKFRSSNIFLQNLLTNRA